MSAARSAVRSVALCLRGDARAATAVRGGQRQGAQHREDGDPAGRADPGVAPVEALAGSSIAVTRGASTGAGSTVTGARRSALRRSWPAAGGAGARRSALRRSCVCACAAGNCRSGLRRSWPWAAAVAGIGDRDRHRGGDSDGLEREHRGSPFLAARPVRAASEAASGRAGRGTRPTRVDAGKGLLAIIRGRAAPARGVIGALESDARRRGSGRCPSR